MRVYDVNSEKFLFENEVIAGFVPAVCPGAGRGRGRENALFGANAGNSKSERQCKILRAPAGKCGGSR